MLALLTAGCSGSPVTISSTPTTTVTYKTTTHLSSEVASTAADRRAVGTVLSSMYEAYNSQEYQKAAGYVSGDVLDSCGGILGYATALAQLRSVE